MYTCNGLEKAEYRTVLESFLPRTSCIMIPGMSARPSAYLSFDDTIAASSQLLVRQVVSARLIIVIQPSLACAPVDNGATRRAQCRDEV
jgi:hypothetical protein